MGYSQKEDGAKEYLIHVRGYAVVSTRPGNSYVLYDDRKITKPSRQWSVIARFISRGCEENH